MSMSNLSFLTKNKEGGQIENRFRHWETIYCHFRIDPSRPEKSVKFRWLNPLGKEEQIYLHTIDKTRKEAYFVVSWLSLDVPVLGDVVGSDYLGEWRVTISLGDRLICEEKFAVY
jgi:hypothetical protein